MATNSNSNSNATNLDLNRTGSNDHPTQNHQRGVNRSLQVLLACSILCLSTAPGHTTGIMNFVDLFIVDLGISRTSVGGIWFVAMAVSSVLIVFAGKIVDEPNGANKLGKISAISFGLSLFGLGIVNNRVVLVVLLAVLRLAGPESMTLVASTTINKWFRRRRGTANGVRSIFENMAMLCPMVTNYLISIYGWRMTYCIVSVPIGIVSYICAMMITNTPEDEGLLPDGAIPGKLNSGVPSLSKTEQDPHKQEDAEEIDADWSFGEAVKTPFFWAVNGSHMLYCIWWAGLNFNAVDFFGQRGLSAEEVGTLTIPLTVGMCAFSFAGGIIADLVENKVKFLGFVYVCSGLVILLGLSVRSYSVAFVFYILYGAVSGMNSCMMNLIFVELFGRKSLGQVTALVTGTWTFMSGCGPMIFGASRDYFGDYDSLGMFLALIITVCGVVIFTTPKPQKTTPKLHHDSF